VNPWKRKEVIGNATLYLGDCLEILPTLPKVDAVITDPPYGIFACGGKWGRKQDLQWDKKPIADLGEITSFAKISVVWGGNYYQLPPSRGWLVWYKRDSVPSAADAELAWTNIDMNTRLIDHTIAATNAERVNHPTQKPVRVMRWTIEQVGMPETILDPFMGSGTTGVACMNLGRKFIGIEIEPKYFDIACERITDAQRQETLFQPARDVYEQVSLDYEKGVLA